MVEGRTLLSLASARLKYLIKIKTITIDNWAFSFHYRFTFICILMASMFVTCTQFFGKPIDCIQTSDIRKDIINSYCWVEGTFTLPKALIQEISLEQEGLLPDKAYPGIDKRLSNDEIITQRYYYWVCVVLFLQGCCFYITRLLWKRWERGYMQNLIEDLHKCILPDFNKQIKSSKSVINFLHKRFGQYKEYAFRFFLCEIFNFFHVILQFKITNTFLDGQFASYGWNMLFSNDFETNPTSKVFPKLAKCTFRRFGSSGDIQVYDNLCLLPINIINEKIYLFLWFIYVILIVISFFSVIMRIVLISSPKLRNKIIKWRNSHVSEKYLDSVLGYCNYGDWFIINLISQNLDPMHFQDVIAGLEFCLKEGEVPDHLLSYEIKYPQEVQNHLYLKFNEEVDKQFSNKDTLKKI